MHKNQHNFCAFKELYKAMPPDKMGLYLGAGINLSPEGITPRFKTYSWEGLLHALYQKNHKRFDDSFPTLLKKHHYDWPDISEELAATIGSREMIEQLDEIIYSDIPRKDKYGRLSKRLLNQAPTLHAAICFSAKIKERTTSYTFRRNEKIGAILTTNYDFFFGAGWTCYQSFKTHWKVQTPFSQMTPQPNQRPVYYIHGYLPYSTEETRDIVLTRDQYNTFYAESGFTKTTLWNFLHDYLVLFIGTSFTDKPLVDMLTTLKCEKPVRHFAIVTPELKNRVTALGVRPILIESYAQVANVLADIYCSALDEREYSGCGLRTVGEYWGRLRRGPRG